jgi:hypothetical protein
VFALWQHLADRASANRCARRQWSKGDGDQRAEHARPGEHVEGGLEAVAAGGQGAFMGSRGPPPIGHARRTTNARLMEMRGRRMNGWLRVDPEHVRPQRQVAEWVELGARCTRARCWQSGRPSKFAQCAVQCRAAERGPRRRRCCRIRRRGCCVFARPLLPIRSDAEGAGESRACDGVAASPIVCSSSRYGA